MATNRVFSSEAPPAGVKGPTVEQIERADRIAVGDELHHLVHGAERYVSSTVALAGAEVKSDARAMIAAAAKLAACGAALFVGYVFGCVALACALAPSLGAGWAFCAVAAANVLVGGAGLLATANETRRAVERIGTRWHETGREITESLRKLRDEALAPLGRRS